MPAPSRIVRSSPRGLAPAVALALALALVASTAAAQNAETRAKGLLDDALEQDFLATNFKAAEAKLRTAQRVCGEKDCPKDLVAKIYRALGVVYVGMERKTDAVEAFKEMVRIDPALTLDANFTSDEVQKAFDEARESVAPAVVERELGILVEEPWAEQAVGTPLPVYVSLPEGVEATKVVVRYKAPGAATWVELILTKHGDGFGGYIPCAATEKEGDLIYFTTAFDANLDRAASGGSAKEPRVVKLADAISGRQPALPDSTPPTPCPREDPSAQLSCETNDDCPGGEVCVDLTCVDESTIEVPVDPRAQVKDNWLTLQFSPDLILVQSQAAVCNRSSQSDGQFSCFFGNGQQFTGDPLPTGNSTNGGIGLGSMRVMVGYDRVLAQRILVGARLGFAFLGHPAREDGEKFFPVHGEVRGAFHFAKDPFAVPGVRPYVFAGGGVADFSARVNTEVHLEGGVPGDPPQELTLDVHQKGGIFWVGGGLGLQYAVKENAALVIEVGARQAFPTPATIISPSLGFAYGI